MKQGMAGLHESDSVGLLLSQCVHWWRGWEGRNGQFWAVRWSFFLLENFCLKSRIWGWKNPHFVEI